MAKEPVRDAELRGEEEEEEKGGDWAEGRGRHLCSPPPRARLCWGRRGGREGRRESETVLQAQDGGFLSGGGGDTHPSASVCGKESGVGGSRPVSLTLTPTPAASSEGGRGGEPLAPLHAGEAVPTLLLPLGDLWGEAAGGEDREGEPVGGGSSRLQYWGV